VDERWYAVETVIEGGGNQRGNESPKRSTVEFYLHSPVARTGGFTIMWMMVGSGRLEKILERLSVGSNLSANFERSFPRIPIR